MSLAAARHVSVASLTWKLLWLRARIFFSSFRHATLRRKIGTIVVAAFFIGLLAGAFIGSWALLNLLRSPELAQVIDLAQVLDALPTAILTGAFLTILLTSFGVLLQSLYLARDMDFLMAAPIPVRAVFLSKLILAILPNFALLSLFGLPLLFGLGASAGYSALFYPLVVLLLICMALSAAGISALLVTAIVRVVPARRVAEVVTAVGAAASLICSQTGNFTRSMNFGDQQAAQMVNVLTRVNSPWSPFAWAGRGLVSLGTGGRLTSIAGLGFTLLASLLVFATAVRLCEVLYHTGWSQMQAGTLRRPRGRSRSTPVAARTTGRSRVQLLPRSVTALVAKDVIVLRRDLRNLSQLITPLILGIAYAVMLARGGGQVDPGQGQAPEWFMQSASRMLAYGNAVIALFIGFILLSRLGMIAFAQEGRSYWLLKSAPVSSGRLLLAKALVAYLPTFVICEGFFVASSMLRRSDAASTLFGAAFIALALAGGVGINLAFGTASVNLDWDDPRHMVRASAGCFASLAGMAYMALAAAFFIGPDLVVSWMGGARSVGQAFGLLLGGTLALVCAWLPLYVVRGRVARIGEAG